MSDTLRIAGAQLAPVWLHRDGTIARVVQSITEAAAHGIALLAFPEAFVPGYPFWIEQTDGARFDSHMQKVLHAHYLDQAVQIEAGHLDPVVDASARHGMTVVLGIIERPRDRGGHSIYASCVTITPTHGIVTVHRKLMPTYEERLSWAPGDGHGLRTTEAIPRFVAREGRSYVLSVCSVLRRDQLGAHIPFIDDLRERLPEVISEGGTAIAAPDGTWIVEPTPHVEQRFVADIHHARVRQERQNFDVAGHYGRPDVLRLQVNRERQTIARFDEGVT